MNELNELTLTELRRGLDQREFSATELVRSALARIESTSALNSFITVCGKEALAAAEQHDRRLAQGERLPLLGIPLGIKDLLVTKGVKTTCASRMLEDFVPPYTATAISRLMDAGAINIGKTNLDEFAMGSSNEHSYFGAVRNPWDLERVPGGTSGGSAAAVAARQVPCAIATDTGGSIRQPASFCGVIGIKPTYGRVSRYGLIAYVSSCDQAGVISRTVADAALVLEIMAGLDPLGATSVAEPVPSFSDLLGQDIKGLRIGIPKEYFVSGLQPEVEKHVRDALQELSKLGAELVEVTLPHTDFAIATYYVLASAEASSNLSRYDGVRYGHRCTESGDLNEMYQRSRTEGFGTEVKRRIIMGTYVLSAGYYEAYYARAQKVRTLIANDFKQVFAKECDLIASPVSPTTAFKLNEKAADPLQMYLSDIFTVTANLAGLPALSIPCGFDSKNLPIGLQLIGKPWDEGTLLKTAAAYEAINAKTIRAKPPL